MTRNNQRTIPSDQPKSVATYKLLSDGEALSRTYHVLSLVVNHEANRIPSARVVLLDGEPAQESFAISNTADFEPGRAIEIHLGYRSDERRVFSGIVVCHAIKVRAQGSVLIVDCKDVAERMTVASKSRYFRDVKDSDVIESLLGEHELDADVAATSVTHGQLVQYSSTDWDMLVCRAEASGMLVLAQDGKVTCKKPALSGDAVLTVQYGATVHELDAEVDARLQSPGVTAAFWDPAEQAIDQSVEAAEPQLPAASDLSAAQLADVTARAPLSLVHAGAAAVAEAQAWADASLLRQRLAKVRGRVTIDGTAAVSVDSIIRLNGVSARMAGDLYVTGVRHTLERGDWQTVIQFGAKPEWFADTYPISRRPAGGLLPAINGLHVGVVTQLEGDPEGEERIQVRVPTIHPSDQGAWYRLATLDAGSKRGSCFRPEINDEVVVGFLDDDPRHGIVLGGLHSSAKSAPIAATDDNHIKGFTSRGELKLLFDDEKKVLTVSTPAGNRLVMSEDEKQIELADQHGNCIKLNSEGITIQSAKDLVLEAATGLKAQAQSLDLKGSTEAKLSGAGGTELSLSGASSNLRGPIVNIN